MIRLDGSFGEGGGQIVRTALALSTITGIPFEVEGIRKGRCDSGLKAQHLHCIRALAEMGARCEGAELGSGHIVFHPGSVPSRTLSVDVGTAGSVTLLLQALLLPVLFADGKFRLRLTGGTDVPWSEPYDYLKHVFLPHVARFAESVELNLDRRGYYPRGGGRIELSVSPRFRRTDFGSFEEFRKMVRDGCPDVTLMEQGRFAGIRGISHASLDLQKAEVAERQSSAARRILSGRGPVRIDSFYSDSLSAGSGICLWAVFLNSMDEVDSFNPVVVGGDSLGAKGRKAEDVGAEAARALSSVIDSGAPVDPFLADQLVPFLALAGGSFRASKITPHCLTNVYVVEQFLGKSFEVDAGNKVIRAL
ncbi:RNA 3'-terminal phosphate cyclase [Candidatus Woesearchaeota archaeon]|nr:RNA 3'-terminal phosphate cyclase [Candidatus Woesearchaeota archaeon]